MKLLCEIRFELFGQYASNPFNTLADVLLRAVAFDRDIAVEISGLHIIQNFANIIRVYAGTDPLSCTTCALRGNGDEVADTFKYAPPAGFKYWGTAGPALWIPYIAPWLDAEKMKSEARNAGIKGCTEVYAPQINTASEAAARACVDFLVAQAAFAVRLECPLLVFSGGHREEGEAGLAATVAGLKSLLPQLEGMPIRVALEPHYHSRFQNLADFAYIFDRIDQYCCAWKIPALLPAMPH